MELIEAELPLEIVRYGMVQDSGGAGQFRGGLAYVREFKLLAADAIFTTRADRRDHLPYGFNGGLPGGGSLNTLTSQGKARALPTMPMEALKWHAGDVFLHVSAGGGGFESHCPARPNMCWKMCWTTKSVRRQPSRCTVSSSATG